MNTIEQEVKLLRPQVLATQALIHKAVMIASIRSGKRLSLKAGLGEVLADYVATHNEALN